jgi:hypothetical protein
MNFLYKKIDKSRLNLNDFSFDLRKFNDLNKATTFCNNNSQCQGIEVDTVNNIYNVFSYLPNMEVDESSTSNMKTINDLILPIEDAGIYILSKENKYYSNNTNHPTISNSFGDDECKLDTDCYKTPTNIYKPSLHKNETSILSAIQEGANCIFILYKCDNEADRVNLNWSKSKLYGIIYTSSTAAELQSFLTTNLIESGKYIVRQIFFIKVLEGIFEYSLTFRGSQIVTYVDNISMKRTWMPNGNINNAFIHSFTMNMSQGVHSIINDFSFDTNFTAIEEDMEGDVKGEIIELAIIPLYVKETIEGPVEELIDEIVYKSNPLLLTNLLEVDNRYFIEKCTGVNNVVNMIENKRCKELFNKPSLSEEARIELKQMFLDIDALEESDEYMSYHPNIKSREINGDVMDLLIEYFYKNEDYIDGNGNAVVGTCKNENEDMDFDTVRFIKERVERYFINMFANTNKMLEPHNLKHILFLLPILSKCGDVSKDLSSNILFSEFMENCADENSDLWKSGICTSVENSIISLDINSEENKIAKEEIVNIIDKRDFIFCTNYNTDTNTYGFENNIDKCEKTVLSDNTLTTYLLSNKCTDMEGKWRGGEYCKKQSAGIGIESVQRKTYYQSLLTDKEKLNDVIDGKEVESLSEFINYATNGFLNNGTNYDNLDFLISDEMVELCTSNELNDIGDLKYSKLCDGVYEGLALIPTKDTDVEKLEEFKNTISMIKKKREVNICKNAIALNDVNFISKCKDMFDTKDETNIILYSGEVLKYCTKSPFSPECTKYYNDISLLKSPTTDNIPTTDIVEGMFDGRIYGDASISQNILTFVFYIFVFLIAMGLLSVTASFFLERTLLTTKTTNITDNNIIKTKV